MAPYPPRDPAASKPAGPPATGVARPLRAAAPAAAAKRALPMTAIGKPPGAQSRPTPADARPSRPVPRRGFVITAEHGLAAAGIAIAIASGCFGIYMNVRPEPQFAGNKYWTVFAQLRRGAKPPETGETGSPGIDPVVTGSIPAGGASGIDRNSAAPPATSASDPAAESRRSTAPLKGYVVRDVFDGMALVESPYGLTLVKPGSVLLGAGQVTGMEMRAGKWVVLTSQGVIGAAAE
jgi:hypothetical protein